MRWYLAVEPMCEVSFPVSTFPLPAATNPSSLQIYPVYYDAHNVAYIKLSMTPPCAIGDSACVLIGSGDVTNMPLCLSAKA